MATAKKTAKKIVPTNDKYIWYCDDGDCYVGSSEFTSVADCELDIVASMADASDVIIAKIVKRARVELTPSIKEKK